MSESAVTFTDWERARLAQYAAATALTYIDHHLRGTNGRSGKSGLFPHEQEEMERWKALSEKLSVSASTPHTPTGESKPDD